MSGAGHLREQARMSSDEVDTFLRQRLTMSVATHNRDHTIHVVGMWYGFVDGKIGFFTYQRSQKVRNLERDPSITCFVETGSTYGQLRGVQLVGRAVIVDDPAVVQALGEDLHQRYVGPVDEAARAGVARNARRRVAVVVTVYRVVSWDHTKVPSYGG